LLKWLLASIERSAKWLNGVLIPSTGLFMANIELNITTTHNRLHLCAQTVWSFLNQTLLPTKINIWVSKEPYLIDKGIQEEPAWARELRKINDIIEFRWTENTGPYRKLFPALQATSEDTILVYADDDTIYKSRWLEKLIGKFNAHDGKYVVASRCRELGKPSWAGKKSYMLLSLVRKEKVLQENFLVTGVGGVVLRASHIAEEFWSNTDFLRVCPKTDDVWISKILEKSGSSVVTCPEANEELLFIEHSFALSHTNKLKSRGLRKQLNKLKVQTLGRWGFPVCNNDHAIRAVDSYFAERS